VKETGKAYAQCYGEGSCNFGRLLADKVCIGSDCPPSEAATVNFACLGRSDLISVQKADGIIGIGHGSTLLKSLNDHHKLISNQISLCLGREDGIFSIGGVDTSIHKAPVRWTPMTLGNAFYYAKPKKVQVGAEDYSEDVTSMLKLPVFDSGTSYSYVPEQVFLILKNFFDQFCAENEGSKCMHDGVAFPPGTDSLDRETSLSCFKTLTPDQKKSFPPIKFIFEGGDFAELVVDPEDYFFPVSSKIDCIGIFKDGGYTIGANLMRSHNIVFDVDKKRLGIAPAICDNGITNKPKPKPEPRTKTSQPEEPSTPGSHSNNQRLARGKCSAKAYDEEFLKKIAHDGRKYNLEFSDDFLTCTKKMFRPFFYQHCPNCGGDNKCIDKFTSQHFAKMMQHKKELVDFTLSVLENPDCSAAFVPMAVKTVRLVQKLGRAPTEVEVVRLLFPEANLAAIGADIKRLNMKMGNPVNQNRGDDDLGSALGLWALRDEDDDIGALPALLMSPAAFKIAAIGQKVGPFIGPMKSAIVSNIRL
jgi:hypothetical protein